MKKRIRIWCASLVASIVCVSCGDGEGEKPKDPGSDPSVVDPPPAEAPEGPTVLSDSGMVEMSEFKRKSDEETEAIYAVAEKQLTPESLIAAAKGSASPETLKVLEKWESAPADAVFIEARHFGKTRFIVTFSGPSSGSKPIDLTAGREMKALFTSHARVVVEKAAAAAENSENDPEPPPPPADTPAPPAVPTVPPTG